MRELQRAGYPVRKNRVTNPLRGRRSQQQKPCNAQHINLNHESLQGFISSTQCHVVFAFLSPLLIGIIQVKFQSTNRSPFQTHPTSMWAFVLAILIYGFALAAGIKFYRSAYSQLVGHAALLTGPLSSVSLVSILLPPVPGRIIFIIWAILPMMVARHMIILICWWIYERIMLVLCKILCYWSMFKENKSEEQLQSPV